MENNENSVSLRLLSAYWCNGVAAKYEDRFTWSWNEVDETVHEIGEHARGLLVALAQTAPGETMTAYFAAGPLEDYVNVVVENKNSNEAAFISGNTHLKPYLEYAWGDIEQLAPLAKKGDSSMISFHEPDIAKNLKVLEPKVLMGFWCHESVSSVVEEYQGYYEFVKQSLFNEKERSNAKHDLLLSAPDKKAKEYLETNIFILHG